MSTDAQLQEKALQVRAANVAYWATVLTAQLAGPERDFALRMLSARAEELAAFTFGLVSEETA